MSDIKLGDLNIVVLHKKIKNIHLNVHPPQGNVTISAPAHIDLDTIRIFAISKLRWIKKQQHKFQNQKREPKREYITKESHYFKGKRYLLKVIERNKKPQVILKHSEIQLCVRPQATTDKKKKILDEWYRIQLKQLIPQLLKKWEKRIGVKASEFRIRKMRTKWGTCNTKAKRIWLNLELAKKPIECLEYIIVHELVHLLEGSHNKRFIKFMDKFMPKWRFYKEKLNYLPLGL
ncbi:M48 family metallopeptidase [Candidatus Uabimicrobium sp. HlEnr_7]|uniref:M48 family metallopeptidase n=1 Tax=Candidatus Uabimicrobium helgolandensis TaxID=3095367 RepID=UPI0035585D42